MVRSFILLSLLACVACSFAEDPIEMQLIESGQAEWMATMEISIEGFREGDSVSEAKQQLDIWGYEESPGVILAHLEQMDRKPSESALIFVRRDGDVACNLNRYVFIEHDAGKIVSTLAATGEAGCL